MHQPTRLVVLAVVTVVFAAGGDALRYLIGYPAWAAVAVAGFVWAVVELALLRLRVGAVRVEVAAYLLLALVSAIWALSPLATLGVGVPVLIVTTTGGLLLACLPFATMLTVLHTTLQGLLAVSLVFETAVEILVGGRLYPLVPAPGADYSGDPPAAYAWSRGLLFDGGRIQGVVGNANLLAMVALLALILAVALVADGTHRRWWPLLLGLPLVTLVLTRSGTVIVAALAVAVVAALLWVRARSRRAFRRTLVAVASGGLLVAAVVWLQWGSVTALLGRDADLTGRVGLWQRVVDLWLASPIVGNGYLGYWLPWVEPFDSLGMHDGVLYLQAHNVWLDHAMQLGIVGLIVWAALQIRAFQAAARWLSEGGATAAVPVLLLVAFAVQGLAESRPMIEIGWCLLVAFACGLHRRDALVQAPVRAGVAA